MTTFEIPIHRTPLYAEATHRASKPQRWITRLRRLLRAPRSTPTPSDRVLDGMREARSIQR